MKRWPHLGLILVLAVWLARPGELAAQQHETFQTDNGLLRQGLELFDQVEYERAVELLSAALLQPGNTPLDLVMIYRTLGMLYVFLDHQAEAEAALTHLLCVAPNSEFGEYASPRVREVFDQVRSRWIAGGRHCEPLGQTPQVQPVNIDHQSPENAEPGQPLELELTLGDPGMRVAEVILFYRAAGEQGFNEATVPMSAPGVFTVTIPGDAVRAPNVEYYLAARDDSDEVLASLGAARAPLRVPVREEPRPSRPSIVRSWWFWTAIGAVVVGTTLGLGLGLGLQDHPQPNQGPHTLTVTFDFAGE